MRFRSFCTILIVFLMIFHPAASCLQTFWTLGTSVVSSLTTNNENNNNNNNNNNGGDGGGGESGGEGGEGNNNNNNNNNNNWSLQTSLETTVTTATLKYQGQTSIGTKTMRLKRFPPVFFVIATMILYTLNLELHHFRRKEENGDLLHTNKVFN